MFPLRDSTHLNPPSQGREKKTAQQIARLRNKCAMLDYSHAELISVSCGLNPSPAFQAPSAQGRQGHTHRIALRFPLSSTRGEGKEECVGDMNQNIFNDTDFSRFTSQFSLKQTAFTQVLLFLLTQFQFRQ